MVWVLMTRLRNGQEIGIDLIMVFGLLGVQKHHIQMPKHHPPHHSLLKVLLIGMFENVFYALLIVEIDAAVSHYGGETAVKFVLQYKFSWRYGR